MGISVSLNCPMCGGTLALEEGDRTTSCPYCSAALAIEGADGIHRLAYLNVLDTDKAMSTVKGWMGTGMKARDLKDKAQIVECYPIYVPFWKLKARVMGWVCGYRQEGLSPTSPRIPMEKMVLDDFEWSHIACDIGDIGIGPLDGIEGKAILHDEGNVPAFQVTGSFTEARGTGLNSIRDSAIESTDIINETIVNIHVLLKSFTQVYYPLWMVRYRYRGRQYSVTIDGIKGVVLSGKAPIDTVLRTMALVVGAFIGGFGASIGLKAMSFTPNMIDPFSGIVLIGTCLVIAVLAYRVFGHTSEITVGGPDTSLSDDLRLTGGSQMEIFGEQKVPVPSGYMRDQR